MKRPVLGKWASGRDGIVFALPQGTRISREDVMDEEDVIVVERRHSMLVVEDDGEMRSLLRDGLWSEGCDFREARNAEEGFRLALQAVPDLIITDIEVAAGGAEYINRLNVVVPHCPIIVMAAFGDEALKEAVLHAGAAAYFSKPVHLADLRACVKQLLDAERHAAMKKSLMPQGVR